jgi:taurine dioxygenase
MTSPVTYAALTPFGVEVAVGSIGDLTAQQREELQQLYTTDGLILIRGLALSMDEQLQLCNVFGPVLPGSRENYLVSNVLPDGLLGSKALLFHHDVPFVPEPYLGGSLHAIDVTEGVSATRFASGFHAYERLPQALRDRIDGMHALHARKRVEGRRTKLTDLLPRDVAAVHPVVGHQERTGRPFVFVDEDMTACIVGMNEQKSDALLEELFSYLYVEDLVYEHVWRNGDIVIWDNYAIQHARHEVAPVGNRTLQRVTIASIGYYDQNPSAIPSFEDLRTAPATS